MTVEGMSIERPDFPRAACIGQTDVMYPGRGGDFERAKAICDGCVHKAECLDFALENFEKFGIWGGVSQRQLARLRRERGIKAPLGRPINHGTAGGYLAHYRRDEKPCIACIRGNSVYQREREEARAGALAVSA